MDVLNSRILLHPRDPEVTTAFYRDTLGLAIYREFPGGTVFFAGGGLVEIVGRASTGPSEAMALWLQVRDLPAELATLRERGVEPERDARREPWGLDEAWLRDPDGVRIVLVQVPSDHPLRTDVRPAAG
ncbi:MULTISPECIES: VOC family protein [Prauserella salsuginis group]|uniref:Catechol 2,3-dioxygenase-like lactoylglutathione lyase family enzyme n=2 Tax=Prauserella salsuginis group TaxID=2893672 RepID=A0A839XEC4_9PSEU|nr:MULTISPECIES: VOC family protein [Prauserella salsuginis group]MBB3661101.1 catechol 2,3-dioxygenase-like lactoylglutathione lyase family enzyme [Prauserella sediminis]MCR3718966.1 Glyoxalase-like domain-containing protein [Prauserella flava]MCR3733536.1 Glyoxalase-like domain-containing protein [Prauserella salsuginis]